MTGRRLRVCVFGLGEAGGAIAGDLAAAGADVQAGADVHGYDPAEVPTPAGVVRHGDARGAAEGADLVLAVTAAADAPAALAQAVGAIPGGSVYADLATASAGLKRELAANAGRAGLRFADVALMAPVPGSGLRTPALASGPGAAAFVAALGPRGMPVEHAGDEPGVAATRKLLRSVVMKGLAALVVEALEAAEAAGLGAETWDNVVAQLTAADEALVRRLVTGTGRHAARRLHEMEATAALLTELGVEPTMTRATAAQLARVAADPGALPPLPGPSRGETSAEKAAGPPELPTFRGWGPAPTGAGPGEPGQTNPS
jgi:3-hydroxyisobutyrate dehydrogenase-like beta-hydroxyacid dehydrogenase